MELTQRKPKHPTRPRQAAPTPEEIAERAALIRAEWSESERMSRLRVDLRPHYRNVTTGDLVEMSAEAYDRHCDRAQEERQEAKWD